MKLASPVLSKANLALALFSECTVCVVFAHEIDNEEWL